MNRAAVLWPALAAAELSGVKMEGKWEEPPK
jgi:hypothetical protein